MRILISLFYILQGITSRAYNIPYTCDRDLLFILNIIFEKKKIISRYKMGLKASFTYAQCSSSSMEMEGGIRLLIILKSICLLKVLPKNKHNFFVLILNSFVKSS